MTSIGHHAARLNANHTIIKLRGGSIQAARLYSRDSGQPRADYRPYAGGCDIEAASPAHAAFLPYREYVENKISRGAHVTVGHAKPPRRFPPLSVLAHTFRVLAAIP